MFKAETQMLPVLMPSIPLVSKSLLWPRTTTPPPDLTIVSARE